MSNMFKDKLKKLRKREDYTQEDLANLLNITRQSVSQWETGLSYPTSSTAQLIAKLFDIDLSDLFDKKELVVLSLDSKKQKNFYS